MAFEIPTREALFAVFRSDYAGAQPTKNISRGSDPYRLGRTLSAFAWGCLSRLLFFLKIMLPDTAEAEFLERWGAVYAFPRLGARGSTGTLALRVTGDVGASVPVDTQLEHEDGTLYKVTSTGAVIGGAGYVDVDVAAISTGSATNKITGEVLTFTSPPLDVDAEATLVSDLVDGIDIQPLEDYRVSLLAHIGDPPEGGASHDYIEWAKRIPGVKDAYVWAHRRGVGTIDVAILGYGTGSARICSSAIRSDVEEYIDTVRPGNVKDWRLLDTEAQDQDVVATLVIDETKYKWDWDDAGTGYTVDSHNTGASTITVSTAPATVIAGVRLTINGEEALVTGRTGSVLTLAFEDDFDGNTVTWFTFDPDGEEIRASGDLVKPVKNAILTLFNTFGPARIDAEDVTYVESAWQADLKLSKLNAAVTDVDGVDDTDITTPSASVVPLDTYEEDGTIPFLSPRYIKIWKAT